MDPKYYSKQIFDSLDTGDETGVYLFEPRRKSSNRVWGSKNAKRPSTANRLRAVKKVFINLVFQRKNPVIESVKKTGGLLLNGNPIVRITPSVFDIGTQVVVLQFNRTYI